MSAGCVAAPMSRRAVRSRPRCADASIRQAQSRRRTCKRPGASRADGRSRSPDTRNTESNDCGGPDPRRGHWWAECRCLRRNGFHRRHRCGTQRDKTARTRQCTRKGRAGDVHLDRAVMEVQGRNKYECIHVGAAIGTGLVNLQGVTPAVACDCDRHIVRSNLRHIVQRQRNCLPFGGGWRGGNAQQHRQARGPKTIHRIDPPLATGGFRWLNSMILIKDAGAVLCDRYRIIGA